MTTTATWVDWLRGMSLTDLQEQLAHLQENALDLPTSTKAIIAAIVTCAGYYVINRPKHRLPPGPLGIPLLGNALEFLRYSFPDAIKAWKHKYGPVVCFTVGTTKIVVLNHIDTMHEAFVQRGSDFSNRPQFHSLISFTEGGSDILMTPYGELLKFQRKVAMQALRQYISGSQLECRVHEVLAPIMDDMLSQEGGFEMKQHLCFSTWNVLHGICFGSTKALGDPTFTKLMDVFAELNTRSGNGFIEDFVPLLQRWPTSNLRETKLLADTFNAWIHEQLDAAKLEYDPDNISTLAANIIQAKHQVDAEKSPMSALFTETHAAQTLADVFAGGVDTSKTTLGWLFLVMAIRQDIQVKVHEEIDAVVGAGRPGKEHRSKLVYTDAVIHEAMRLYPVVPLGLPHETMRDTTVGGYDIPKGTTVLANQIGIMHDAKNWPDPLTFDPERFLDATGTKVVSRPPSWIPFSLGQRACPGESMAKLTVGYIVAGLLQRLHFSLAPGETADLSYNHTGFLNEPKAYRVVVKAR